MGVVIEIIIHMRGLRNTEGCERDKHNSQQSQTSGVNEPLKLRSWLLKERNWAGPC